MKSLQMCADLWRRRNFLGPSIAGTTVPFKRDRGIIRFSYTRLAVKMQLACGTSNVSQQYHALQSHHRQPLVGLSMQPSHSDSEK